MFEDYTYERLLTRTLAAAPPGIDTRQGSIFYDAVAGVLNDIAKLYTDLDLIFELVFIDTASGEQLDMRASEFGITRLAATPSRYYFAHTGATPPTGTRFFTDGMYFSLRRTADDTYYLEAEIAGTVSNYIVEGTTATPVNTVAGLTSAEFGAVMASGTDAETDNHLRQRVREKISGPAENGNRQHYKTWCESRERVGRARIFPLWNGPNTVKAVLIDDNGAPCDAAVVAEVQNYIDPNTLGTTVVVEGKSYNVGDGLGEGVANLGAHFTAAAADELVVDVQFTAEISGSATPESAKADAEAAIADYFRGLVLGAIEGDSIVVRISSVGAILSALPSIIDYTNLTLNGGEANITPTDDEVPALGEVTIDVA